jgi:hypothetical protein
VATTTLLESTPQSFYLQPVDAFTNLAPNTSIYGNVGGQRGLTNPDNQGFMLFDEIHRRPNVDLVEVQAQGYLKAWLNLPALSVKETTTLPLFTAKQLDSVLASVDRRFLNGNSFVVGNVAPERYKRSLSVAVYNSHGKRERGAEVFFFGEDMRLSDRVEELDPIDGRFVITGLEEGEYHVVLSDAEKGYGLSMQVIRVAEDTVSHVNF